LQMQRRFFHALAPAAVKQQSWDALCATLLGLPPRWQLTVSMLRTLILGGTGWLGSELAQQLVEAGHEVTALARAVAGTVPDGVRLVRAERS
jgi:hypothetical protein